MYIKGPQSNIHRQKKNNSTALYHISIQNKQETNISRENMFNRNVFCHIPDYNLGRRNDRNKKKKKKKEDIYICIYRNMYTYHNFQSFLWSKFLFVCFCHSHVVHRTVDTLYYKRSYNVFMVPLWMAAVGHNFKAQHYSSSLCCIRTWFLENAKTW